MTENLKNFLEYASQNEDAMKKIKALADETDKDAVVRQAVEIAKDANLSLSAEDFEENASGELSEDELASVAGGKECYCAVGGGGESDGSMNKTCACVHYGQGNSEWGGPHLIRCACFVGGYGVDT